MSAQVPTVKEQFDARVECGDWSQTGPPIVSMSRIAESLPVPGCHARDWRVFRFALGIELKCRQCGLRYAVTLDPWPKDWK